MVTIKLFTFDRMVPTISLKREMASFYMRSILSEFR